jgi:zinc transporter
MTSSYGAHQHGLICGYLFTPAAGGKPLGLTEAVEWLLITPPSDNAEFIWLHFDLTDASAQTWMQTHLALTPEFFEALQQGSRSTRIEDAQGNLIAVVNDVAYEFAFDPSEIATLWLSVSQRVAVSARAHRCVRLTGCARP